MIWPSPWIRKRDSGNGYNWKKIHNYVEKSFEDKINKVTGGQTLAKMRRESINSSGLLE